MSQAERLGSCRILWWSQQWWRSCSRLLGQGLASEKLWSCLRRELDSSFLVYSLFCCTVVWSSIALGVRGDGLKFSAKKLKCDKEKKLGEKVCSLYIQLQADISPQKKVYIGSGYRVWTQNQNQNQNQFRI